MTDDKLNESCSHYHEGFTDQSLLTDQSGNTIIHYYSPGGGLPEKLGGGVRHASQNPYPIYYQNLTIKSKPCFWPASL